jgi:phosphoglycolate phosphatase
MAGTVPGAGWQAAILDLDGTLVHTLGDFAEALQRMLRDLPEPYARYTVQAEAIEPLIGKGSENLIKRLLALIDTAQAAILNGANRVHEPASVALLERACARYQHHYAQVNGQFVSVYPGVLAGLAAFKALGWPLACVTNKPTAFAQDLLRATGLDAFFVLTLGGDAVARKKPDPLPLQMACQHLGVAPEHTVMIGDSSNDAQAARAAGCPVWLMTYGYNHGQPVREVDADGFADSLLALPWLR